MKRTKWRRKKLYEGQENATRQKKPRDTDTKTLRRSHIKCRQQEQSRWPILAQKTDRQKRQKKQSRRRLTDNRLTLKKKREKRIIRSNVFERLTVVRPVLIGLKLVWTWQLHSNLIQNTLFIPPRETTVVSFVLGTVFCVFPASLCEFFGSVIFHSINRCADVHVQRN